MDEFFFYKTGVTRSRDESLHDLLITAKDGLKRTRIMYGANLSWNPMLKMLKLAEAAGLIEEVEEPRYGRYGKRSPAAVWRTTEKGLRHAKIIYDNFKLLQEAVG